MTTIRIKVLAASLCAAALMLAGCNDFERTAFQTLSASKAAIDQAQVEYETRTIPHVQASFDVITKAKQAQTTAVDAMIAYESIKTAKGPAASLQAQQQIVVAALAQVVPLIADVKALIAAPAATAPAHAMTRPGDTMPGQSTCRVVGASEADDEDCPGRITIFSPVFVSPVRYAI